MSLNLQVMRFRRLPELDQLDVLHARYSAQPLPGHSHASFAIGMIEAGAAHVQGHCAPAAAAVGNLLLDGKPSQVVFGAPDAFLQCDYEAGVQLQQSRRGTERAVVDSPWQLPGEFVVGRSGVIRLAYRYQYCEDWPNALVLIRTIKEALWESK